MNAIRISKTVAKQVAALEHSKAVRRRTEIFKWAKRIKRLPRKPMSLGVLQSLGLLD